MINSVWFWIRISLIAIFLFIVHKIQSFTTTMSRRDKIHYAIAALLFNILLAYLLL